MDHTRLRDAGIKATYPRLKILDIFHQHAGEHMSAADLYRSLIADRSNIGLATVYRVITQLEEAGLLKRTQLDAHTTVYEINDKGHHDHMVCTHCGRILESSDPSMSRLVGDIARRSGFALESYSLVLYGGCGCARAPPPTFTENSNEPRSVFFHDLSHFPIVTAKHGGAPDGYSASWIREMEMLVNNPSLSSWWCPTCGRKPDTKTARRWWNGRRRTCRDCARAAALSSRWSGTPRRWRRSASAPRRWREPSTCRSWRSPVPPKPCSARAKCWARPAGGFNLS